MNLKIKLFSFQAFVLVDGMDFQTQLARKKQRFGLSGL